MTDLLVAILLGLFALWVYLFILAPGWTWRLTQHELVGGFAGGLLIASAVFYIGAGGDHVITAVAHLLMLAVTVGLVTLAAEMGQEFRASRPWALVGGACTFLAAAGFLYSEANGEDSGLVNTLAMLTAVLAANTCNAWKRSSKDARASLKPSPPTRLWRLVLVAVAFAFGACVGGGVAVAAVDWIDSGRVAEPCPRVGDSAASRR